MILPCIPWMGTAMNQSCTSSYDHRKGEGQKIKVPIPAGLTIDLAP